MTQASKYQQRNQTLEVKQKSQKSSLVPTSLFGLSNITAIQVELEIEIEMHISSEQLKQASEVKLLNLKLNITINDWIPSNSFLTTTKKY